MTPRFVTALLFINLLLSGTSYAQYCMKGGIEGEGQVVRQEISVESFSGINLGFSGDVVLTPGSTRKVMIEGQQNIIDNIKREVNNGTWDIVYDKNVQDAKGVTVYITLPSLKELSVSGSGSIASTGKFSGLGKVDISVTGSGDIEFEYDAQSTDLSLSGSGEINLMGASKSLSVNISGSGDVRADDLVTDNCEVDISGSGNASVLANTNLRTSISGSGDVDYSGSASIVTRISGSGEVSKIR